MKIVTYEQRVAKMNVPGDEDVQLRRAKQYMMRLRNKAKQAKSLKEKLEIGTAVREAEQVLYKIRLNIFDLEDMLYDRSHCTHTVK